jgi:hypothetical protein
LIIIACFNADRGSTRNEGIANCLPQLLFHREIISRHPQCSKNKGIFGGAEAENPGAVITHRDFNKINKEYCYRIDPGYLK